MNILRGALLMGAIVIVGSIAGCVANLSKDHNRLAGYQAYRNGDYDAARERFERILDADPTDWRSHYFVGLIALDHDEDPDTARRHLDIAYTLYQGRATKRLNYQLDDPETGVPYPTRSEILDATAEAVYRQGHEQTLHAFLREAIQEHGAADDYLRMGRYMEKINDPDSARSAYRGATRLVGPRDPVPYIRLADFYDGIGDRSSALIELRKAYGIDPEHPEIGGRLRAHGVTPGPTVALPYDYAEDEDAAAPSIDERDDADADEGEDDES